MPPVFVWAVDCVDGSGFPDGLSGAQLGLTTRLISATTALIALCGPPDTPGATTRTAAIEILRANGRDDPGILNALAASITP